MENKTIDSFINELDVIVQKYGYDYISKIEIISNYANGPFKATTRYSRELAN